MANYDAEGNFIGAPIEKGQPRKNKAGEEKGKPKGGLSAKRTGTRGEKLVAKTTGGTRTPGSGAFKNTNHNLEGDVEVPDADGKPYIKLEVKVTGIEVNGEKQFIVKKSVLDQAVKEAHTAGELAGLTFHFKGQSIDQSYIIMQIGDWKRYLEDAKVGRTVK